MVKRELIGKHYFYVARFKNGKKRGQRRVKNSKISLAQAKNLFKRNKTFDPNIKRTYLQRTNVNEVIEHSKTSFADRRKKATRKRPKRDAVYEIQGTYKGKVIVARSRFDSNTSKQEAWENFLYLLSNADNPDVYDDKAGEKIIKKVKDIKEGWAYWEKK